MRIPVPVAKLTVDTPRSQAAAPASHPAPAEPFPRIAGANTSATGMLRRQRKSAARQFFLASGLLAFIGSTVFATYVILDRQGFWEQDNRDPKVVVIETKPVKLAPKREIARRPEPTAPQRNLASPVQQEAPRTLMAALPMHVELPISGSFAETSLFDVPAGEPVSFTSIDDRLTLQGSELIWSDGDTAPVKVARLEVTDDAALFQWLADVPDEAASAARNAILEFGEGEKAVVALRSPLAASAVNFSFDKKLMRVTCKCPDSPNPRDIMFTASPSSGFPPHRIEGTMTKLSINDEAMLWYTSQEGVATRVRLHKTGTLASADFATRYRLPSGEEGPLTIGEGKKKRIELSKLLAKSTKASNSVNGLKQRLATLQREKAAWQSKDTRQRINGSWFNNPVAEADKAVAITRLDNRIRRGRSVIAEAERLSRMLPDVKKELSALDAISLFVANNNQKHSFSYRFFITIAGHDVTIVSAE